MTFVWVEAMEPIASARSGQPVRTADAVST
jgi:hypothetical protein